MAAGNAGAKALSGLAVVELVHGAEALEAVAGQGELLDPRRNSRVLRDLQKRVAWLMQMQITNDQPTSSTKV